MWMNESEIESAADTFALHPVLGPATATLQALVDWTNRNSDGWPYWRKPAQAAAKVMELVQQGIRHEREAYQMPRTPEPTAAQYKAALVPLKSFRTRQEKTSTGLVKHDLFAIYDREGGPVWAAEREYRAARDAYESVQRRADALKEVRDRAGAELNRVREREALLALHAQYEAGTIKPELIRFGMFELGARIYRMPHFRGEGADFDGLGQVVTVTGMSDGMHGPRLTFVTDDGVPGIEYNPMTETEARLRWWILDGDGTNLVSGGLRDRARIEANAAEKHPGCLVRQGAEFIGVTADAEG